MDEASDHRLNHWQSGTTTIFLPLFKIITGQNSLLSTRLMLYSFYAKNYTSCRIIMPVQEPSELHLSKNSSMPHNVHILFTVHFALRLHPAFAYRSPLISVHQIPLSVRSLFAQSVLSVHSECVHRSSGKVKRFRDCYLSFII